MSCMANILRSPACAKRRGRHAIPQAKKAQAGDMSEADAESLLSRCKGVDILITHSPPKGVADVTSQGISVGSTAIRAAIETLQPHLALCGHIHDSWGQTGRIGETRVVNLGPTPNWFEIDV